MKKFSPNNPGACFFQHADTEMSATTHLGIGAHADDLEIMAYHGIATCYASDSTWFGGVTVTNGVGSPQSQEKAVDHETLRLTRQAEQNEAAELGRYAFIAQLDYESAAVKAGSAELVTELADILMRARPRHVYLHQPADKHPTHVAVLQASLAALSQLPVEARPEAVFGCEVWRDLDWLPDDKKVYLATDQYPSLAADLIAIFQSQISAGVDYVEGTLGRRAANGTFADPHLVKEGHSFTLAIDLMPVVTGDAELGQFVMNELDRFREQVKSLMDCGSS